MMKFKNFTHSLVLKYQPPQRGGVAAADLDFVAIQHCRKHAAVAVFFEMFEARDVDESGTMHALKTRSGQSLFERAEAARRKKFRRAGVNERVIIRGFEPIDIVESEGNDALAVAHEQTVVECFGFLHVLQEVHEAIKLMTRIRASLQRAFHCGGETLAIVWFQKIINGIHFECANGKIIIRRGEDDHGGVADALQHFEAVEHGHLHVEKDEVGAMLINGGHGLFAVFALGKNFNLRIGLQKLADDLTRKRLVVDE